MNEQPKKKKHSLWWIWLILILAAFAGGIVTGLKLNTLPLPNEVRGKLYPILESYIPGSTKPREAEPAAETPAPEETSMPMETAVPEEPEAPVEKEETQMIETVRPEEAEAPAETAKPEEAEGPVGTEAENPVESLVPAETETTAATEEKALEMSETAAFTAEPQTVKYIGVNKAQEIAKADVDAEDGKAEVTGVFRTKDEDGNAVYEVSFTVGEVGYDYVIDAVSGEVLSWKMSGLTFSDTAAFGGENAESVGLTK